MSLSIITEEQLANLQDKQPIQGVALIKDYSIRLTQGGKEYVAGKLQSGKSIGFKVWGNASAFSKLKNEAYENVPSYITAVGDNYGGHMSLVIESVQAVEGFTPDQFFPVKYNIDAYWEALKKLVASKVSDKALAICNSVLFENTELAERFKVEFAAKSHHDNCKGGLLAHTYKMVSLMSSVMAQYPALVSKAGVRDGEMCDLLYVGALLHDIGKTVEMNFGVYQPVSVVTHSYLGAEFIQKHKEAIISAYNEEWYYYLISIILEHHGEWGERPKTVVAKVVHLADVFDASLTELAQETEALDGAGVVRYNGEYLSV